MEVIHQCKLCGSRALFTVKRYRISEKLSPYWQKIITLLHLPHVFTIRLVACRNCGFLFYQDMMTFAEMNRLYEDEARHTNPKAHQLKTGRLWEIERMIQFLAPRLPGNKIGRVLDIGSGDFMALERIRQLHPRATYEAVDPSYPQGSHKGVRVFRTMVENWHPTRRYDLVMLVHVLEHIGHLAPFVQKIWQLVKNGGYLYVEVPFQVGPGLFLNRSANVQHVNYFTPQSLSNLLRTHHMKVVEVEFDTTAYPHNGMPGMIRVLARKQSVGKTRLVRNLLPTLWYLGNPLYIARAKLLNS